MKRGNAFEGFRYRKVANNKGSVLVDSRVGDEFRKSSPLPGCAPLEVTGKVTRQCRSSALVKDSQSAIHNDSKLRQGRRSSGRDRGSTAAQASRDAGKPPSEAAAEGGLAEKLGDRPLRLVIVGHNPSAHAWASGHYYSNPSNWMWRILLSTGIAPEGIRGAEDDGLMMSEHAIGFTDVGSGKPGTDSSSFKSPVFQSWSQDFYSRLAQHAERASKNVEGCQCGNCGAPMLVAFAGKRQYIELLNINRKGKKITTVPFGRQEVLPEDWPFPDFTEVWVCSSTSGAAAMTTKNREAPYRDLAARLAQLPQKRQRRCQS